MIFKERLILVLVIAVLAILFAWICFIPCVKIPESAYADEDPPVVMGEQRVDYEDFRSILDDVRTLQRAVRSLEDSVKELQSLPTVRRELDAKRQSERKK